MNPLKDAIKKKRDGVMISIELGPDDNKIEPKDLHEEDNKEIGIAPDLHESDSEEDNKISEDGHIDKLVDQMNEDNQMDKGNDESLTEDPVLEMSQEDRLKDIAEDASQLLDGRDETNIERKIMDKEKPKSLREKAQFQMLAQKKGMKY